MNVLYCDDDVEDVETFKHALRKIDPDIGCTVAIDGSEGLDMLMSLAVEPHAIFVDLHMPKLDGREFVIAIKRNRWLKRIPLIVLSSNIERKHVEQLNKLGVFYFISKSVGQEELQCALESILSCLPNHNCI